MQLISYCVSVSITASEAYCTVGFAGPWVLGSPSRFDYLALQFRLRLLAAGARLSARVC